MRLLIFFTLLFSSFILHADIYSTFKLNQTINSNYFMSTKFKEVIRFNPLQFEENTLNQDSSNYINDINTTLQKYIQNNEEILITIIGHSHTDNESLTQSKKYAQVVQSLLIDANIPTELMRIEARGSKDPLWNSNPSSSNRVMLTMYVKMDQDQDHDGVLVDNDHCPKTKIGMKVGNNGCKIATIIMLMDIKAAKNSILITSGVEEIILDKSNAYTLVSARNDMSSPQTMSEEERKALFGSVIARSSEEKYKFILYFERENLLKKSQNKLNEILDLISKKDDYYIKITGHTDTTGSQVNNQELSQKRVNVIMQKIHENKLKYLKIYTKAHGENKLAVYTQDDVTEPLNRRVEISIH